MNIYQLTYTLTGSNPQLRRFECGRRSLTDWLPGHVYIENMNPNVRKLTGYTLYFLTRRGS
jgi:hypothetical protein